MVGSGRGEPVSPLPWAGVGCPPRLPRRRPSSFPPGNALRPRPCQDPRLLFPRGSESIAETRRDCLVISRCYSAVTRECLLYSRAESRNAKTRQGDRAVEEGRRSPAPRAAARAGHDPRRGGPRHRHALHQHLGGRARRARPHPPADREAFVRAESLSRRAAPSEAIAEAQDDKPARGPAAATDRENSGAPSASAADRARCPRFPPEDSQPSERPRLTRAGPRDHAGCRDARPAAAGVPARTPRQASRARPRVRHAARRDDTTAGAPRARPGIRMPPRRTSSSQNGSSRAVAALHSRLGRLIPRATNGLARAMHDRRDRVHAPGQAAAARL